MTAEQHSLVLKGATGKEWHPYTAPYVGACFHCTAEIPKGDRIVHNGNGVALHLQCCEAYTVQVLRDLIAQEEEKANEQTA